MTTISLHNGSFGSGPNHRYPRGQLASAAVITITVTGLTATIDDKANSVTILTNGNNGGTPVSPVTIMDANNNSVASAPADGTYTFTAAAGTTALRAALSGVQALPLSVTAAF
jgi:hypothetical protein